MKSKSLKRRTLRAVAKDIQAKQNQTRKQNIDYGTNALKPEICKEELDNECKRYLNNLNVSHI